MTKQCVPTIGEAIGAGQRTFRPHPKERTRKSQRGNTTSNLVRSTMMKMNKTQKDMMDKFLDRLEQIVYYYNNEVFEELAYSLTANESKVIVLANNGELCGGLLFEVLSLTYAYRGSVAIYAEKEKPYIAIKLF